MCNLEYFIYVCTNFFVNKEIIIIMKVKSVSKIPSFVQIPLLGAGKVPVTIWRKCTGINPLYSNKSYTWCVKNKIIKVQN